MEPTTKELMACFVNPTKSSILLAIQQSGESTAKELLEKRPDIPQATLYRTLKQLAKIGIIHVVSEKKVRAVVERTYALNDVVMPKAEQIIKENNGPGYFQLMSSFTLQLMAEFSAYAERPDIDILHDGSGFSATPIYANEEELQALARDIAKVLEPYQTPSPQSDAQQKCHTMALVLTPPQEA